VKGHGEAFRPARATTSSIKPVVPLDKALNELRETVVVLPTIPDSVALLTTACDQRARVGHSLVKRCLFCRTLISCFFRLNT
jgi:hypothetical protein